MMALEKVVQKSLANLARKGAPVVTSGAPTPMSYASVVARQMTKTAIRIRIEAARRAIVKGRVTNRWRIRDSTNAEQRYRGVSQSASKRNVALNMRKPNEFKNLRQGISVEVNDVP